MWDRQCVELQHPALIVYSSFWTNRKGSVMRVGGVKSRGVMCLCLTCWSGDRRHVAASPAGGTQWWWGGSFRCVSVVRRTWCWIRCSCTSRLCCVLVCEQQYLCLHFHTGWMSTVICRFPFSSSLSSLSSSLSSLLQPEDGMVRMQSPLKLQIRAAATLLIALPCFKMSVCESVNKHNCTIRASLCKTALKCKRAHKAARRSVPVRADDCDWSWEGFPGWSWDLRLHMCHLSSARTAPTHLCCRALLFSSTQVFIVSLGRQQRQAQFCQRQRHAAIKSSMWGIKSRNRETNRPELKCVSSEGRIICLLHHVSL